jgi:hypothetical protein
MYNFTITAANATAGDTYTNNGYVFTVLDTITGATLLTTTGTGAPEASGTLTLISGAGSAVITFSAVNLIPDNRLRFPAPLIDFATEVGLTGQDHERFPYPDAQPRWDWMLIWYMSLLANQSSYDEPMQYRDGTLWFDLNTLTLKIWRSSLENISGSWLSIATSTELEIISGVPVTLDSWYTSVNSKLSGAAPISTFSGYVNSTTATEIPIPVTLQGDVDLVKTRPFVYINGLLVDPRSCEYYTVTTIKLLNGITLSAGDTFTVVINNIISANFSIPDVVI